MAQICVKHDNVTSGGNNFNIENATFLSGYYQIENSSSANAYAMNTSGDTPTHIGQTYTSEYFNVTNYWNVTINKPCNVLYVRYGENGFDSNYIECKGGETFKGNYSGTGKVMILIFQ